MAPTARGVSGCLLGTEAPRLIKCAESSWPTTDLHEGRPMATLNLSYFYNYILTEIAMFN